MASEIHEVDNIDVELPSGEVLAYEDLYSIAAAEKSVTVALLGEAGSGKTTLITSLYQMFLQGTLEGKVSFSGSHTIQAFEKRAFFSRITSQGNEPVTPRTQLGSLNDLLHLRTYSSEAGEYLNLLFTDSSGEEIQSLTGDIEAASNEFPILREAKHVCIVLDGDKLAKPRRKNAEIQGGIQLLKTFINGKAIRNNAIISIVITKYDLLKRVDAFDEKSIANQILDKFLDQIPTLKSIPEVFYTAAMPSKAEGAEQGYGLNRLMLYFIEKPPVADPDNTRSSSIPNTCSQFDLWKDRIKYEEE